MSGNFNGQILVDKLSKLNSSQQSIETLSHWCIFHRKNAKQVVETWDRQFHCSSRERRVAFLYLANDILQNSRRKGSEFVVEFWKFLSGALADVLNNGDDADRRAATRLIDIWEERKVFGSRGQALKEDLLGRNREDYNRNGKISNPKPKNSHAEELEKIISSYEHVCSCSIDEEAVLRKCQDAIVSVEKLKKDSQSEPHSVGTAGAGIVEDMKAQNAILRETIEQLKTIELSRAVLASHLRESLREQELKLQQVRNQLQAAHTTLEGSGSLPEQRIDWNSEQLAAESRPKESVQSSEVPSNFVRESQVSNGEKEKSVPVMYTPQVIFPENAPQSEDNNRKSTAAAVAAKLAASTSSAQMLCYVLSSLASEGVIGQQTKDENPSGDHKRMKLDNGGSYMPTMPMQQPPPPPPPPPPSFPHPDSLQHMPPPPQPPTTQMSTITSSSISPQVPPPSLPLLQPPLHPNQFMQNAGPMTGVPYSYGTVQQLQHHIPMPGYQMPGMPPFPSLSGFHHNTQVAESNAFSSQPPLPGTAPPAFSHQ